MRRSTRVLVVGAVVGAVAGFGLGALAYGTLAPALETAGGVVRELQGFAWNLVPLGTLVGGVLGGWAAGRLGARGDGGGRDGRDAGGAS